MTQANLRNVEYRNLKITVKAPFDLRGYLALDAEVRPGFGDLEYTVEVDSDADDAILDEIKAASEATSPMFDNILQPTGISGQIARV